MAPPIAPAENGAVECHRRNPENQVLTHYSAQPKYIRNATRELPREPLVFMNNIGGERGIRTLEGLLTLTPLAGVRLRPLGHLSDFGKYQPNQ